MKVIGVLCRATNYWQFGIATLFFNLALFLESAPAKDILSTFATSTELFFFHVLHILADNLNQQLNTKHDLIYTSFKSKVN